MKELVSVIIPSYNREKTIVRAVQSVLEQTYQEIEVIIVDDCSNDNTKDIITSTFAKEKRVKYHCLNKNSGACRARNIGIKLSNGKFIAFLDSDDIYAKSKIEKQVDLLKRTNSSLCATDYTYIQKDGQKVHVSTIPGNMDSIYKNLLYCNFITTGTLLGYKDCFIDNAFDESLPRYQDWDLVLRLCQKYTFCFLTESTLIQFYQTISISASTNHSKTLAALTTIYNKNIVGYKNDSKAYSQIHWLMGLHSIYIPGQKDLKSIWKGVIANGFKLRRMIIFIAVFFNLKGFIKNKI